jgi:hypothetical protein
LNIRWGNTIEVPSKLALQLIDFQQKSMHFTAKDIDSDYIDLLAMLLYKDAITSPDMVIYIKTSGVNIDPSRIIESRL